MPTRRTFLCHLAAVPFYLRNLPRSYGDAALLGTTPDPVRGDLAQAFMSPPEATRPYVLWMWMGCNISKPGITRDLEAMKEAGIGGATIFSLADTLIPWAGVIGKSPTPEIVTWTEPWWAMVHHAASECRRLGLELILHNCAGYESSGGTWITPELAMQEVIWSQHTVRGGAPIALTLDKAVVDPHPHSQFPELWIPSQGKIAAPIVEGRKTYYRDIAVLALPAEGVPTLDRVLDLSAHMDAQGELRWDAPAGDWVIYRFGHTTTGSMIQPAQWDAIGLECDKMSTEAVTFHVRHVLGEIRKHLGDLAGPTLTTLYFDSYEAGDPTWTPKMRQEFQARRGYDIVPWLPVIAGRSLGSAQAIASVSVRIFSGRSRTSIVTATGPCPARWPMRLGYSSWPNPTPVRGRSMRWSAISTTPIWSSGLPAASTPRLLPIQFVSRPMSLASGSWARRRLLRSLNLPAGTNIRRGSSRLATRPFAPGSTV